MPQPTWTTCDEARQILEALCEAYPEHFPGSLIEETATILTRNVKRNEPVRLVRMSPVHRQICTKKYIIEVIHDRWQHLSVKQKQLAIFHALSQAAEDARSSAEHALLNQK